MLRIISDVLSGLKATIVGGVFLAVSLAFMLLKISPPADPAWITVVLCGYPLLYLAVTQLIFQKRISSALLISVAISASIAIGELFAAGEIAFIMALGAILENKTAERAQKGLKSLVSLAPTQGRKINGNREETIPAEHILKDDILRVLPGETIPVDGEVVAGASAVNQSVITGESLPIDKTVGDGVFCGTINCFGSIDIKAAKVGEDSTLQKLIQMMREAERKKAPAERIMDRWAAWLVPTALLIAIVTYFLTFDIVRAVTVLVVFCPCALVLATPTSIMAAIGQAAKYGVVIKSGDALERMGNVNAIAFDKTGTLTYGNLNVSDILIFNSAMTADKLLSLAASAESYSEHPLGKAIAAFAREKGAAILPANNFRMFPGQGISANVDGKELLCGSSAWLQENGATLSEHSQNAVAALQKQGKAAVVVAANGESGGVITLSDTLRPAANGIVKELEKTGSRALLLTGDNRQAAEYFANMAGITDVYAELLPAQKTEVITELQNQGMIICMVGDGVNDAPALKTAYVGVAMGAMGSDIAVDAADIALMNDDVSKIPYLKRLSNATIKLIKLNIAISLFINFAAIILSVLALLNPVTGALVHNAGAVLVTLNAALLYDRKFF